MTTHLEPPTQQPLPPPPPAASAKPKRPWYRRTWVAVVAALLVGVGIGSSGASSDPTASPQFKRVSAERDKAEHALSGARSQLMMARAQVKKIAGDIPAREAKVSRAEKRLAAAQAALTARERAVAKREHRVGLVERTIARNTVSGDGMYQVGKDIQAGTYKSSGATGCYYAVLRNPNTFAIVTNNNTDGPAFVSVQDGQYLQTERCADWVLQH